MNQAPNESMDRLTQMVARAGGISDEAAERVASAPFLHARLRARIEAERRRRAEQGSGWLSTLFVASRAIAILSVVTIASVVTFWLSKSNASVNPPPLSPRADAIAGVVTGGTCALSTTDECAISTEEVLATLFAEDQGVEPK
ncbi:MAG TPA: hypothetical protein VLG74_14325 [Blastocatellia bacterium]|nr:hypothetical protein [Blastocatellia bacterium]